MPDGRPPGPPPGGPGGPRGGFGYGGGMFSRTGGIPSGRGTGTAGWLDRASMPFFWRHRGASSGNIPNTGSWVLDAERVHYLGKLNYEKARREHGFVAGTIIAFRANNFGKLKSAILNARLADVHEKIAKGKIPPERMPDAYAEIKSIGESYFGRLVKIGFDNEYEFNVKMREWLNENKVPFEEDEYPVDIETELRAKGYR